MPPFLSYPTTIDVSKLRVVYDNGEEELFDTVVAAVGRYADTQGLGLAAAGVVADAKSGKIPCVNERTNVPHIYAIGDVVVDAPGKQSYDYDIQQIHTTSNIYAMYTPSTILPPSHLLLNVIYLTQTHPPSSITPPPRAHTSRYPSCQTLMSSFVRWHLLSCPLSVPLPRLCGAYGVLSSPHDCVYSLGTRHCGFDRRTGIPLHYLPTHVTPH